MLNMQTCATQIKTTPTSLKYNNSTLSHAKAQQLYLLQTRPAAYASAHRVFRIKDASFQSALLDYQSLKTKP